MSMFRCKPLWSAMLCLLTIGASAAAHDSAPAAHPPIPPPPTNSYEVRHGVRIAMRDGTLLSADIYLPTAITPPFPTVLVRTPYGKDERFSKFAAELFATRGYVVVAQDKRGRFESGGEYTIATHEIADSYDTIDWIAHQPWSNQRVGAYGCSDRGDAVIYAAAARHPALKAAIPEAAAGAVGKAGGYYGFFSGRNGGAVELAMGLGWFADNGTKFFLQPPAALSWDEFQRLRPGFKLDRAPPALDYDKLVWSLPLVDILRSQGLAGTDWDHLAGRELTDAFFDRSDFLKGSERFNVPALHVNSWYDFGVGVTFFERDLFARNADSALARDNQFAVISPTLHCQSLRMTENYKVGDRSLGDPRFGHDALYVRWFDYWLKGVDNGVTRMPKVQYYLMGRNAWREASTWPAPGSREHTFLLGGATPANGPAAAGVLARARAKNWLAEDRYTYDPANPVPSIGGSLCCITSTKLEGAYDQREVEVRPDVLVYSTPPLERGVAVAGPMRLVLFVSSSAADTDFTAKLVDVYPDGTAYNVQESILRARYRHGFDKQELMTTGSVYELELRLPDTANYFGPGHRIRLEVSSSSFPRFDRNLNTGGRNFDETSWSVANNVIHRDARHPSRLILTVLNEH